MAVVLITVAFTFLVSALNVRYRDVQHLIGLALLVWFWMTPIVYSAGTVYTSMVNSPFRDHGMARLPAQPRHVGGDGVPARAVSLVTDAVLAPYSAEQLAAGLSIVCVIAVVAVYLTWRLYFSMSGDFAEEL